MTIKMSNKQPKIISVLSGAKELDAFIDELDFSHTNAQWQKTPLIGKLPDLLFKGFIDSSKVSGYNLDSVKTEILLKLYSLKSQKNIIHFHEAQTQYWHSADWIGEKTYVKNTALIATFSKPQFVLEKSLAYRKHLKKLDRIIITHKALEDFFAHYIDKNKIIFVPQSIDSKYYKPAKNQEQNKEQTKLILITKPNSLDEQLAKELIKAVKMQWPNYKIIELENVPKANKGDELALFQKAAAYLHFENNDGLKGSLLKAMACKTPIVAYQDLACEDYLSKKYALLVSRNSDTDKTVQEFIESIETTLESPEEVKHLQNAARKKVSTSFSHKQIARKYQHLYEELASQL